MNTEPQGSYWGVTLLGLAALTSVLTASCATIGKQTPIVATRDIGRSSTDFQAQGAVADIEQEEGRFELSVAARHRCEVREQRRVIRTSTTENENTSPTLDWLALGVGAASAVAGGVVIADASNVYPSDETSRTYNQVGPGTARGIGWALVGAGAALITIPIVDAARANATTVDTTKVSQIGAIVPGRECSGAPYPDAPVAIRTGEGAYVIGATDAKGLFTGNLDEGLPSEATISFANPTGAVLIADHEVGPVNLRALYVKREGERFKKVADICRSTQAERWCQGVRDFLGKYPDGPHSREAKQLIEGYEAKKQAEAESRLWGMLNVRACGGNDSSLEVLRTTCAGLGSYLENFPNGPHVEEVKVAYTRGQERIAKLQAKRDEEEEKARKKARADAEAAERRAQEREKAAERKELEQERARCRSQCSMICSSFQFRHNPGACLSGA